MEAVIFVQGENMEKTGNNNSGEGKVCPLILLLVVAVLEPDG